MNGQLADDSDDRRQRANDQIDLEDRATDTTVDDDILGDTNLGLGNYSDDWLWMQVESYRKWAFADASLSRPMHLRVIDYALTQKAKAEWDAADAGERRSTWETLREDDTREMDRRRWLALKKADIWDVDVDTSVGQPEDHEALKEEKRRAIINEWGRGDLDWTPPFGRLLKTRHEASRSLGARLIDNLFRRVTRKELQQETPADESSGLGPLGGDK